MSCFSVSHCSQDAIAALTQATVAAIDTETTGLDHRQSRLVGVSIYVPGSSTVFYLPVYSVIDGPNSLVPLDAVRCAVRLILDHPHKVAIMHNAEYDLRVLRRIGVLCRCRVFDTALAAHRLDNTHPHVVTAAGRLNYKLKTLTRHFFNVQQQTFDEVTQGLDASMVSIAQLAPYAAADAYYTGRLYELLSDRLADPDNAGIAAVLNDLDFPIQPLLVDMLHKGMPVDPAAAAEFAAVARKEYEALTAKIGEMLGTKSVKLSDHGLRRVLGSYFRVRLCPWTSLSKDSLKRIGRTHKSERLKTFIGLVLARRLQAHRINSFFRPLAERTVPRLRRLYVGSFQQMTESGRFSARNPNVLALPKNGPVRSIITAPRGSTLVAMDFSNIEPRCMAQGIVNMIEDQGTSTMAIRQENRDRAKLLLQGLPDRHFLRQYAARDPLPYPTSSAWVQYLQAGGPDPYAFAAKQMFSVAKVTKTQRDRAKKLFLTTSYGQGLHGIAEELAGDGEPNLDEARHLLNRFDAAIPELGVPIYSQNSNGGWTKSEPTITTLKAHVQQMIRLTGEVESLFGRKRRFSGLWHFDKYPALRIEYHVAGGRYEFNVTPIQRWNYVLHCFVHAVTDLRTGQVIATSASYPATHPLFQKLAKEETRHGQDQSYESSILTAWPYKQLAYRAIRCVRTPDGHIIENTTLEDAYRQGFNSMFQMTAADIFKRAMLAVVPVTRTYHAQLILNLHDELLFVVPNHNLGCFVRDAHAVMTSPPADWWIIPLMADVKVGRRYGQMVDYKMKWQVPTTWEMKEWKKWWSDRMLWIAMRGRHSLAFMRRRAIKLKTRVRRWFR